MLKEHIGNRWCRS